MRADLAAAPMRPRAAPRADRLATSAVRVCCLNIAAIVFLQRIVVPLGGELGASCLLPIAWVSMTWLLIAGRAGFDAPSLLACTLFFAAAVASQVFGGGVGSATSLLLLFAIYLLCTLRIQLGMAEYLRILGFFQRCMMAVAALVGLQYATQVAGLGMPILEHAVPERLIARDFIYIQEVVYGSGIYKPNALVMLEASFLSQFLALALIIEFWVFRRPRHLMLFGTALVFTFSGTGLLLATITIGLMMLKRGLNRAAILLAFAIGAGMTVLAALGLLDAIVGRVEEFSRSDSSGSNRFILPFTRMFEVLAEGHLPKILWGAGAGFIDKEVGFAWPPATKVWVEYGLVVFCAYWIFLASLIRATPMPMIAVALALEYLILGGGSLLQPPVVFACFFLGVGYAVAKQAGSGPYAGLPGRRPSGMAISARPSRSAGSMTDA